MKSHWACIMQVFCYIGFIETTKGEHMKHSPMRRVQMRLERLLEEACKKLDGKTSKSEKEFYTTQKRNLKAEIKLISKL